MLQLKITILKCLSIWYTKDGGITLNKEGNFPDILIKAILPNPLKNVGGFANEVIIGTDLGVWYCNNFADSNPTWKQSFNGMSNVKVTDLDMRNDYTVYAATYGRGIFSGQFTNTTLSNQDIAIAKGIELFPNPSNGILNVTLANYSGFVNVEVYDLNGRKVIATNEPFSMEKTINLQGLTAGIYVVKILGEGLNYSEKLILSN